MSLLSQNLLNFLVRNILVDVLALLQELADVRSRANSVRQLCGCIPDQAENRDV